MRVRPITIVTTSSLCGVALALGIVVALPAPPTGYAQTARQQPAPAPAPAPACNEQPAREFLKRSNYIQRGAHTREEHLARRAAHEKATRYRTEEYGRFEPFGRREWNHFPPSHYAQRITVFGLPVRLNRRIVPAVRCAEAEIQRSCTESPYTPVHLSGLREENTFRGGEVSNHVFGIALDVDPLRNTCCGCVARWRANPLCKREVSSIYERMAMPECWVRSFEKYGFYWLGHDALQDTMHFEFLGDPDRILADPPETQTEIPTRNQ